MSRQRTGGFGVGVVLGLALSHTGASNKGALVSSRQAEIGGSVRCTLDEAGEPREPQHSGVFLVSLLGSLARTLAGTERYDVSYEHSSSCLLSATRVATWLGKIQQSTSSITLQCLLHSRSNLLVRICCPESARSDLCLMLASDVSAA